VDGVLFWEEPRNGPTVMLKCDMSVDPRTTLIGSGVLPPCRRAKIRRDIGANIPSKTSGESGVSRLLRKRVIDPAEGGVEDICTPWEKRRGELDVGTEAGDRGVWGTSNEPGRSPMGRSLTFEFSCGDT
jgi:hypothetical protein